MRMLRKKKKEMSFIRGQTGRNVSETRQ